MLAWEGAALTSLGGQSPHMNPLSTLYPVSLILTTVPVPYPPTPTPHIISLHPRIELLLRFEPDWPQKVQLRDLYLRNALPVLVCGACSDQAEGSVPIESCQLVVITPFYRLRKGKLLRLCHLSHSGGQTGI